MIHGVFGDTSLNYRDNFGFLYGICEKRNGWEKKVSKCMPLIAKAKPNPPYFEN